MSRFRPSRNYVSGKVVFDGGPVDISGDLVVSGSITANEYNVNVINTNVTHIDADGNTKFGDTPDDTHQFTGSVFINGRLAPPTHRFNSMMQAPLQVIQILHGITQRIS